MRLVYLLAGIALLLCISFAQFDVSPYLYAGEQSSSVNYTTFQSANGTATLVLISGQETFLLVNGQMLTDKAQISSVLGAYYTANFYPSAAQLSQLQSYAQAFNASRNYATEFGPAEETCLRTTGLLDKPCSDLTSCMQTASLVCYLSEASGCEADVLAPTILSYKQSTDKLSDAYSKFEAAYGSIGPSTLASSLSSMDAAFVEMKSGADEIMQNPLRFPASSETCADCMGICPEGDFDYNSITKARQEIATLQASTAPFALLGTTVDKIALSTQQRQAFQAGEEGAAVYQPKLGAAEAAFGSLTNQTEEAKALAADSGFVTAANSFLDKQTQLEQNLQMRNFAGFDALLSSYQSAGRALALVVNNSTAAYRSAAASQDRAGGLIIEAEWRVNKLSQASVDAYNSLAARKNALDGQFKPPETSAQYAALASSYDNISNDANAYIAASSSFQDSVFGIGNTLGRASVDGVMGIASSMVPVSFQTRQSVAKYAPVLVVGAIDVAMLAVVIIVFVAVFYYFRGFFRSKLAISGWALTLLGFVFVLLVGSVGLYSIIANSDKFVSYSEFYGTIQASSQAAVIVEETGASDQAITAMSACADQIAARLSLLNKTTSKYYINGNLCDSAVPKNGSGTYNMKTGLAASACLNSIPDVPIFDLYYSQNDQTPIFTTVVTKSATIKGDAAYYGKQPMCDPATVLG